VNGEVVLKLDVAGPSPRVNPTEPEERVPEVANFALFEAKFLPGLPDDSERLADLLAALEATRLDLLRLRAGQGTPDQITHTMTAARELGDDIERLLSARAEMDAALRMSRWPLGAERTPA